MDANRGILVILALILALAGCSGTRPSNLGFKQNKLAACPKSPNCVSTYETDAEHSIAAIPYTGTLEAAEKKLVAVIKSLPRTKIITDSSGYVYAEFTSFTWRFVDDVEFVFDDSAKEVNFRSASRLGYGDMGVNRKRMETIRSKFAAASQP